MSKKISTPRWTARWAGAAVAIAALALLGAEIAQSDGVFSAHFATIADIHRFGVEQIDRMWLWAVGLVLGAAMIVAAGRVRRERMIFFH